MSATHRHVPGAAHEHEFEPQAGLPERLPAGERILWQGSPDWRVLARRPFGVRLLTAYFAALLALRGAVLAADGLPLRAIAIDLAWLAPWAVVAVGMAALAAWLTARTAVYTITDRRVVMRIGIVLTLTFNLPLRCVRAADVRRNADGSGDLPLALGADDRIALLQLWPHARPWRFARPEPMLRGVPDVDAVAAHLARAWSAVHGIEPTEVRTTAPAPQREPAAVGAVDRPRPHEVGDHRLWSPS